MKIEDIEKEYEKLDDSEFEKEKNKIPDEIKPLYHKHHFPEMKSLKTKSKMEKKECEKKVYCQQCNDFIREAYCKKGYNCYEHAKTLKALHIKHKDLGSEKELSKHENGLNHMHGINSETSVPDSKHSKPKVPKMEKKENLDETKTTERFMVHISHCPQCGFRIEVECHESEKSCLKCGNPKLSKLVDYDKWIKLMKEIYSEDKKPTLEELNKFADEQIALQESHYFHKPKETKPKKNNISLKKNDQNVKNKM